MKTLTNDTFNIFKRFFWTSIIFVLVALTFIIDVEKINIFGFKKLTGYLSVLTVVSLLIIVFIVLSLIYLLIKMGYTKSNIVVVKIVSHVLRFREGLFEVSIFTKFVLLGYIFSFHHISITIFVLSWIAIFFELGNYHNKKYHKVTFIITMLILILMTFYALTQVIHVFKD